MPPIESMASGEIPHVSPEQMMLNHEQMMVSGAGTGMIIFQLALYVFYSYCLFRIAKNLNEQYAWMAWVPVLSFILTLRMAKMSLWWILGLIVPFLNIYIAIRAMHDGISKRTGHGGWWTAGLFFFGFIFLPITAFTHIPVVSTGDGSLLQD